MQTRRISAIAGTVVLVAGAVMFAVRPAASQDSDTWFTQDVIDAANSILSSSLAQFLSGDGVNALERQSGRLGNINASAGGAVWSPPFQSSRFEVMVNDPADDRFAAFDVTSHSETATAAFDNNVVVAFNDSTGFVSAASSPAFSGMGYAHSSDGGASFQDLGNLPVRPGFPLQENEGDPGIVVDRNGVFYASYILFDASRPAGFQNTVGVSKSTNGGLTWTLPVALPVFGAANAFLDKCFIAVDATGGASNGNVYVTFTNFPQVNTGTLPIMFSRSTNGGMSFSTPIQLSGTGTRNQGSEPVVGPNGEIYVTWWQASGPGGSRIMVAKSTNGGVSFGAPVPVSPVTPIGFSSGSLLGNFRVNSFPRIDVNQSNGNVYIAFASRPGNGDSGDAFFVRSTNGGATWSSPLRINDDPGDNDQFFPDLAVGADGTIRVIWYDKRRDPNNVAMTVFTAVSTDGGLSFGPNQAVTPATFPPAVGYDPVLNRIYMGDYIDIKAGASASGRTSDFFLAWTDCRRFLTSTGGTRPNQDVFFSRK
jgi:hypothetical protein